MYEVTHVHQCINTWKSLNYRPYTVYRPLPLRSADSHARTLKTNQYKFGQIGYIIIRVSCQNGITVWIKYNGTTCSVIKINKDATTRRMHVLTSYDATMSLIAPNKPSIFLPGWRHNPRHRTFGINPLAVNVLPKAQPWW